MKHGDPTMVTPVEDYGLNRAMASSHREYMRCLRAVGLTDLALFTNLSSSHWHNYRDVKRMTCASFKTFAVNCTAAATRCLGPDTAQLVLGKDLYGMTMLMLDGKSNGKQEMYYDFQYTDCDVFGGSVAGAGSVRLGWGGVAVAAVMMYRARRNRLFF